MVRALIRIEKPAIKALCLVAESAWGATGRIRKSNARLRPQAAAAGRRRTGRENSRIRERVPGDDASIRLCNPPRWPYFNGRFVWERLFRVSALFRAGHPPGRIRRGEGKPSPRIRPSLFDMEARGVTCLRYLALNASLTPVCVIHLGGLSSMDDLCAVSGVEAGCTKKTDYCSPIQPRRLRGNSR